MTEDND